MDHFEIKNLRKLDVSNNSISNTENFRGHPSLETLIMNDNMLTSMSDLKNMPKLEKLNLTSNPVA